MSSREEHEVHHIEQALEVINSKLERLERDKARLTARKEELEQRIARRRWDVT